MKKTVCLAAIFSLSLALVTNAEIRTWTATDGRTIKAELVGVSEDGEIVTFQRTDGKQGPFSVEKLSKADQEYIKQKKREEEERLAQEQKKREEAAKQSEANRFAQEQKKREEAARIAQEQKEEDRQRVERLAPAFAQRIKEQLKEQQEREQQAKVEQEQERARQEQEQKQRQWEEDSQKALIVGAVVGGVALIILLVWAVSRQSSKCPLCKKAWGKQIINTLLIDSRLETRGSFDTVYHYNSKGEVTGSTTIPTTKIVTVKTYENECRCKHCGYEWSYTHTTET